MPLLAVDTEVTGLDLFHGAKPYFVTTCDDAGQQRFWEWMVDPLTRQPLVHPSDLDEICDLIFGPNGDDGPTLVLQNCRFDIRALTTVWPSLSWPWAKTYDTLVAGHLLASNQPHDLTSMALHYLGVDIEPLEKAVEKETQAARRLARSKFPTWRIAKEGEPDMPSAKTKTWKTDMWLPRALAAELGYADDHPWWTVLRDYANADSAVTVALWTHQERCIRSKGLWKIFEDSMRLPPTVTAIENVGVTLSSSRLTEQAEQYAAESERLGRVCVGVAKSMNHDLLLPKSGNNRSLLEFVFKVLKVSPLKRSKKTGAPSLDKDTLDHLEATLPASSKALLFVRSLNNKRRRDTAGNYLRGYQNFWLPTTDPDTFVLHPSLNQTGTDTIRFSSNNPNSQNLSSQSGFNLRHCFGPAPGWEWWSIDAKNIELRIPAYAAGETDLINVFEHPTDPPYYGSYHLVAFAALHPDKFREHGKACKDLYEASWYRWVKGGNFACIYGAQQATADRAYHVPGAYAIMQSRFPMIAALNTKTIKFAEKHGYIETIPDRTVDPDHGYQILCSRTDWGRVLPTVPFNYYIQGSATWWMRRAMVKCQQQLTDWRQTTKFDGHIVLQVHDELVISMPKSASHPREDAKREAAGNTTVRTSNLWRIRVLQKLMEQGGQDFVIPVPTPTGATYHEYNYAEGEDL